VERIDGLGDRARARLHAATIARRDANGWLRVTSQRFRDQARNLEDAREKVRVLVRRAMAEPKRRRATAPTAAARERRLEQKHRTARRKRLRRERAGDDQ